MTTLHLDFETRGVLDLREVGLHKYARDPNTDVWCCAFAVNDGEPQLWTPDVNGSDPALFVSAGYTVVAHNAPFELEIWNQIMAPRYGWPELKPEQTFCTMAQAYAMGLPGALEDVALALGLNFLKDTEGRALMLRMARPRRIEPDGTPVWWDEPEKLQRLYEYCRQDVRVERAAGERLMPLSNYERRVWLMNHAINKRGVAVDTETAQAAVKMIDRVKLEGDAEIGRITGGAVQTHTALLAMKSWIADHGVPAETLRKDDVVELLAEPNLPDPVQRVLTIRQEIGKASLAKLDKLLAVADGGRIYDMTQYHAAATGRFAGRGVQVHNLIRDVPDAAEMEAMLALVRAGNPQTLALMFGPPLSVISRCLRGFFVAPPGEDLVVGDFSGVEGRGTAWVSGEEWKLQAFRDADAGTGPGIYESAYGRMYAIDPYSVRNPSPERQIGKVAELLLGFGGSIGALRRGGGALVAERSDADLAEWVNKWRDAHPAIAGRLVRGYSPQRGEYWYRKGGMWNELNAAAKDAVLNPGMTFAAGAGQRGVQYKVSGSFLWCLLPSGRCLCYPYPKILPGQYGNQLTYMAVPGPTDKIIFDKANAPRWARVATYGGSLMENCVQALCRDLLVDCMLRLHDLGTRIVLHVHDEIVIEAEEAKALGALDKMREIMNSPPAWAKDFPLRTKPAVMRRYGK